MMSGPPVKRQKLLYDSEEEARLERVVFGDGQDVIEKLLGEDEQRWDVGEVGDEESEGEKLGELSGEESERSGGESGTSGDESDGDVAEGSGAESDGGAEESGAAWVDPDDKTYTLNDVTNPRLHVKHRPETHLKEYLQNKFTKLVGTPKWAEIKTHEEEDSDSEHEILKHSNHLAPVKTKKLAKGLIEIKALRNINNETQNEGPFVTNLRFHPTSTVAFATGLSGVVSLFQIDGKENKKLQSIKFDKFPVNCARFLKDGTEIILGTRYRNYCQIYDLMSGKTYKAQLPHNVTNAKNFEVSPDGKLIAVAGRTGEIHLLNGLTKESITTVRMNKKCCTMAFTPDSKNLITHGESEEIYIWDVNTRRCTHRAVDDGCLASGAVAVSPSGQFLATGSKQGVVNIYDTKTVMGSRFPQPLKIVLNLVTPITSLKFNPTSEILAMASQFKENAFRMIHLPSLHVFSNFPTFQTVMHNPLDIDFSPNSGYLGISNNKNNAYLYRLKHFGNY
ncbi:U3 small nucleolar RNA-associated protein 18 homolog [Diachasma alloeum]|uniref:U3 small nucleolar RNA-associated protein 18 homolog n=1 Tax=Diachasma alloeum TaxID=454923 RepID=UPI000738441D|nr:U3 small nucleolar RNA-associated protein 18 homolog [Diachasma alloeum]XP_015120671.1 U3 small nucleolar RNA-associated protein 18 homolog [Diachasma alloeum]